MHEVTHFLEFYYIHVYSSIWWGICICSFTKDLYIMFPLSAGNLSTSIDLDRFDPGQHTLLITAQTSGGLTDEAVIRFNVSVKPLSKCNC